MKWESSVSKFNQDLSRWNTLNMNEMEQMFEGAAVFNQEIILLWDKLCAEIM
jgi:hypothetical protein